MAAATAAPKTIGHNVALGVRARPFLRGPHHPLGLAPCKSSLFQRPMSSATAVTVEAKGPRMAKSIDLATDASRRAALLLSYIPAVCAFVAPCPPGASTAIFDRLSHARALTEREDLNRHVPSARIC